jgi:hypothetical protein
MPLLAACRKVDDAAQPLARVPGQQGVLRQEGDAVHGRDRVRGQGADHLAGQGSCFFMPADLPGHRLAIMLVFSMTAEPDMTSAHDSVWQPPVRNVPAWTCATVSVLKTRIISRRSGSFFVMPR